jgi:hypothetical protein
MLVLYKGSNRIDVSHLPDDGKKIVFTKLYLL